jgi:O-antigen/teichoic acid export membrane protein
MIAVVRRRLTLLAVFFAGQGMAQALNLAIGFLVLHWLSVEDYAQFGLTFGFQSTANILVDLGFSSTIVALVGDRVGDERIIGNYVRSGRSLRGRIFAFVMPTAALMYFLVTSHLGWSLSVQALLLMSLMVSIYFSGLQAYYSPPLLIQRKLGAYYKVQISMSVLRLLAYALVYESGHLDAVSAVWINALSMALAGWRYRRISGGLISEPPHADPSITREMIHYIRPNIPGTIFFAFQGQIAVFLIAAFGHSRAIAEVAALSRIGQIFVLLSALNPTIIEPWIAKSPAKEVFGRYVLILSVATGMSAALFAVAVLRPESLLWILGRQYRNLAPELRWTVLTGCASYMAGMTWSVISGGRLIYWSSTFTNIGMIVGAQIGFLCLIGVSTPLQAVEFGFVSTAAALAAQIVNLALGSMRGPRVMA